jgi:hypothetical protein
MNGGPVPPVHYTSSWRRALLIKHDKLSFSSFIPPKAISIGHQSHDYQQITTVTTAADTTTAAVVVMIINGQRPFSRKVLEPLIIFFLSKGGRSLKRTLPCIN